ncbi:MAG: nucleotide sugar dehydrogenase, partial [Solirubrobacteraceae bacterium]|nr:nucleotide sugar dehydrogenase [Solirubrobacteraceae bacterium]
VAGADAVVVATNHPEFSGLENLRKVTEAAGDPLIVDPWNAFGAAQVFAYAKELSVLAATTS